MVRYKNPDDYGVRAQFNVRFLIERGEVRPHEHLNAPERALVEEIRKVLEEYAEYLPLTKRQVFYRLVAKGIIEKEDIGNLMGCLLRATWFGELDYAAFRDDTRQEVFWETYADPADFLDRVRSLAGDSYVRDRQEGQSVRIEVRCEANGMVGTLADFCMRYGIPVLGSGGQASHTVLHRQAQRITNADKPTVILLVGDMDLAGGHIKGSAERLITEWVNGAGAAHKLRAIEDVAVTSEQVERYELIHDPEKPQVQAEALAPDQLAAELEAAVLRWFDPDIHRSVIQQENNEATSLVVQLDTHSAAPERQSEEEDQ